MGRHKRIPAIVLIVGGFAVLAISSVARAQGARIPNGELAVAYRQLQEGKLSEAVFQNWLECSGGQCVLTTLTRGARRIQRGWCGLPAQVRVRFGWGRVRAADQLQRRRHEAVRCSESGRHLGVGPAPFA